MSDQYDGIIARLAAQRAVATLKVDKPSPDVAGRANQVARALGLPPETADRNLDALEREVEVARATKLIEGHPALAAWMGDPRHAAVAQDDAAALARHAEYWRRAATGSLKPLPRPAGTLWNSVSGLATSIAEGVSSVGPNLRGLIGDFLPDLTMPSRPGVPTLGRNRLAENARRARARSQSRVEAATPDFKSDMARYLYGGAKSVAFMGPSIAAATVTGSPIAGLAVVGAQTGVPAYNKYRDRGAGRGMAALGGALEGGIEVATEKLPMGFLVNRLGKVGAGRFITGFLARELPTEIAATVGQSAVDTAIANPDKTWKDFANELPDELAQTAVATLMAGGVLSGLNRTASRMADRHARIEQGRTDAEFIDGLDRLAATSKTRVRDRDAYAALIERLADGSSRSHAYVSAERNRTYFESDTEKLP